MKTTKQDFERFKTYCLYWQRELGLDDWHLYFYHKSIDDSFAQTTSNPSGRGASITFNTKWVDRPTTDDELKQCALHEVLHIVTSPLLTEARSRFADEYTMDAEEHSIVTRMTNIIIRRIGNGTTKSNTKN